MIILLTIFLILLIVAAYPLGLAFELDYQGDKAIMRLFWLPLPPLARRVTLWRREAAGEWGAPDWERLRKFLKLRPYIEGLAGELRLRRLDCRGRLAADLAANAAATAALAGALLAGLHWVVGVLTSHIKGLAAARRPRLEIGLGEENCWHLQAEAYLPLGLGLLHIGRLYRAYSNIVKYDRSDGYAGAEYADGRASRATEGAKGTEDRRAEY